MQNLRRPGVFIPLLFAFLLQTGFAEADGQVIYVGPGLEIDNIKYGIAQANDGDTIIVKDGTYVQDIKVFKSVVLMAENRHGAVIGNNSDIRAQISVRRGPSTGVVIDGFRFASSDIPGILVGDNNIDNSPVGCTIRNNLIEGRKHGILVSKYASGTVLEGNVIRDCSGMGIHHMGFGENLIKDDTIENCQGAGVLLFMDDDPVDEGRFTLKGNVIRSSGLAGVSIERSFITLERNLIEGNLQGIVTNSYKSGIAVRDSNLIINNRESGIELESGTVMEIRGNVIKGNGMSGITSHGRPVIEKNRLEDNADTGIRIRSGVARIKDNDILGNHFFGIEVEGGGDSIRISDCRIGRNREGGVQSGSDCLMEGNTVFENGGDGIVVVEATSGMKITGDSLRNNMGNEIFICKNAQAIVRDCVIEEDSSQMEQRRGLSGIVVEGSARIQGNLIRNIIDNGIHLSDLSETMDTIDSNRIERCGIGLFIQGPARLRFNEVHECWYRGVQIEQPAYDVTLYHNEIIRNFSGIRYNQEIPDIVLRKNTIRGNEKGIIAAGEAVLRSNTITRNDSIGMVILRPGTDLGNLTGPDSGFNIISDNGNWNIFSRIVEDVPAYYNWWGLSTADSIDATIRDDDEEAEAGRVLFEPFLADTTVLIGTFFPGKGPQPDYGPVVELEVFPNPFRERLDVWYTLGEIARVEAAIVDISGKIICYLPDQGIRVPGKYRLSWDARTSAGPGFSTGACVLVIKAGGYVYTRKVIGR